MYSESMETFECLKSFPFVQKLIEKNKKLKKEKKDLKRLLKLLTINLKYIAPDMAAATEPMIKKEKYSENVKMEVVENDINEVEIIDNIVNNEIIEIEMEEEEEDNGGEEVEVEEGDNGGDSPVEEEVEEGDNGGDSPVEEEEEEDNGGEEEEEEDEVFEIVINKKTYYTDDKQNGTLYDLDEDGEISVEVGKLINGKPKLNK